jgi:hypothetical protein
LHRRTCALPVAIVVIFSGAINAWGTARRVPEQKVVGRLIRSVALHAVIRDVFAKSNKGLGEFISIHDFVRVHGFRMNACSTGTSTVSLSTSEVRAGSL